MNVVRRVKPTQDWAHEAKERVATYQPGGALVGYIVVGRSTEGDMSHGVHAVQHEVEHQIEHEEHGHGDGHGAKPADNQNKKIALLIAVIALFLAFSETLGKSAQTAALSFNVEASNLWAFYQAKTIRQTTLEASAELVKLDRLKIDSETSKDAIQKALSDRVDNSTSTVPRYNSSSF